MSGTTFEEDDRAERQGYQNLRRQIYIRRHVYSLRIFTALHEMQTRSSDEKAVCLSGCPSVRLSVRQTRELWQNGRTICPHFIPYETSFSLVVRPPLQSSPRPNIAFMYCETGSVLKGKSLSSSLDIPRILAASTCLSYQTTRCLLITNTADEFTVKYNKAQRYIYSLRKRDNISINLQLG